MSKVPYRTTRGELIKNDPIWIPTTPGMSLYIPDLYSYNSTGLQTRNDHHWLIINETPDYVDAVMTTTLESAVEEKHRVTRCALFNDSSYIEPIMGNQSPPFPSKYEKEIGICYDTVVSIPKAMIYATKGVRIDADGETLDPNVLAQIRKGCYATMEEINQGFPHDPYNIDDPNWSPEKTYKPNLVPDKKTGQMVYPFPVQQIIATAQEKQRKEREETKALRTAKEQTKHIDTKHKPQGYHPR